MILRKACYVVIAMITVFSFQSCNDDNGTENTARIQLKLIDAPGDYLEVNVEIVDVQYNNSQDEEGWVSFESFGETQIVDLTELVGGVNLVLSNEIIPAGTLKQIRLVLGDGNSVVVEGEGDYPLNTPSAQQSGLKLNLNTQLEGGFSYAFILDWDVQKSIVKTGSEKYILKPVIRVEAEAITGAIEGVVTGDKSDDDIEEAVSLGNALVELYKAGAIEGDEPYATTSTNDEGYFLFEGLATIDYEIAIEQEGFNSYESNDITVVVKETQNVGTIILEVTSI